MALNLGTMRIFLATIEKVVNPGEIRVLGVRTE